MKRAPRCAQYTKIQCLNACNARFLRLSLVYAQSSTFPGNTEPNLGHPGLPFQIIGTEGGFLSQKGGVIESTLLVAPAERLDLIVDFRNVPSGAYLILYNDAPAPFPGGDDRDDFCAGNPQAPQTQPGFGPNTRTIMQFRVTPLKGAADPVPPGLVLPPMDPAPLWNWHAAGTTAIGPEGVLIPGALAGAAVGIDTAATRELTLNEDFDRYGRLIQRMGTNVQLTPDTFARAYSDAPTETPTVGSVEIWRLFNLSGDVHPIHFHLANVQIIARQKFDEESYNGTPTRTGNPRLPRADERGWKETVRMYPGDCTTVIMKFDLPTGADPQWPGGVMPVSSRTGVSGSEYVYHCHILDHEEHDMMRPLIVV